MNRIHLHDWELFRPYRKNTVESRKIVKVPNAFIGAVLLLIIVLTGNLSSVTAQTLTTLVNFNNSNGKYSYSGLTQGSDGNFYGTTYQGGSTDQGTVFRMAPDGSLMTLVNFTGSNGSFPYAGLIQGRDGNFYGTTYFGGSVGYGTVFKITANGSLTTLVNFNSAANGANPRAGLVQGSDGNFYGTTQYGGSSGAGTVFKMTPDGTLTTLVNFNDTNGANPHAGLVEGNDGNFYGTTQNGGSLGYGTVFQMSPNGLIIALVNFKGSNGTHPYGGLIQGSDGNFYGTTYGGGSGANCSFSSVNCGTLYRMTPSGTLTTLVNLTNSIGAYPYAELVQGSDGNFYGTTSRGGTSLNCSGGCGTVFQMTPSGTLTTQVNFSASNGNFSAATLVQGSNGNFYGTTNVGGSSAQGGSSGYGTIFQLNVGAAPPAASVSSFLPTSGPVGTTVVITGANFVGATAVKFNGIPATSFTVNNGSHVTTTLPTGATSGTISVTTAGGTAASSANFTVTTTPSMTLTASPTSQTIAVGDTTSYTLTLNRNNFTGNATLFVTGLPTNTSAILSPNPTTGTTEFVTLTVPNNATTGSSTLIFGATGPALVNPVAAQLTIAPPATATNLNAKVNFSLSSLSQINLVRQTVTVTNHSGGTLNGPLYLALNNLTSGVTVSQINGSTSQQLQGLSPLALVLPMGQTLANNAVAPGVLLEFRNNTISPLSYGLGVQDGQANDKTSLMGITPSALAVAIRTGQTVTVTNTSSATLNGPFYLSAENLTPGASLSNRTTVVPSGAPAIGLTLSSLAAGAQTKVTLQLNNPTLSPLSYTPAFFGP